VIEGDISGCVVQDESGVEYKHATHFVIGEVMSYETRIYNQQDEFLGHIKGTCPSIGLDLVGTDRLVRQSIRHAFKRLHTGG